VLHVDLERAKFFELMRSLDERDLRKNPVRFDFELNAEGALGRLQIDDTWYDCSLGNKSDISELSKTA